MKSKFFFPAILIAGLMLISFSTSQVYGQTSKIKPVKEQTVTYTCPQHPEVSQNKTGTCPKCGMTLVEKKDKPKEVKVQKCDSTKMKSGDKKMMRDSSDMKKMDMKNDTASMKHNQPVK